MYDSSVTDIVKNKIHSVRRKKMNRAQRHEKLKAGHLQQHASVTHRLALGHPIQLLGGGMGGLRP